MIFVILILNHTTPTTTMNPHIQLLTAKHDHLYPHPTQVWEQVNLVTLCENLKSVQGYQRVPMGQEYPLRQTTDYVMQSV